MRRWVAEAAPSNGCWAQTPKVGIQVQVRGVESCTQARTANGALGTGCTIVSTSKGTAHTCTTNTALTIQRRRCCAGTGGWCNLPMSQFQDQLARRDTMFMALRTIGAPWQHQNTPTRSNTPHTLACSIPRHVGRC